MKGFIPVLLVIGVVSVIIIIAGGAYYFGKKSNAPTTTTSVAQVKASPIVSPIPDQTANWKTYSDPKNNYTFKYPPDWELTLTHGIPTVGYNKPGSVASFFVIVGGIEELKAMANELNKNGTAEDVTLDGVPGKKATYVIPPTKLGTPEFESYGYDFIKGDKRYQIAATYPRSEKNTGKIIDQILSTFKFTN